ncbi:hypothetical protein [Kitasatospora sp. NPDC050463]|uniref:hypothetical protein n=1 Tax=Kitasatospora sp. NPDC050463 TaxID=3155786 RepID=UPI0033C454EF
MDVTAWPDPILWDDAEGGTAAADTRRTAAPFVLFDLDGISGVHTTPDDHAMAAPVPRRVRGKIANPD